VAIPVTGLRMAFEVNVIAPAVLAAVVLPGMLAAGWGRIVNVSSAVVARPQSMTRGNAYAATKAALEAHTVTSPGTATLTFAFRCCGEAETFRRVQAPVIASLPGWLPSACAHPAGPWVRGGGPAGTRP